MRGPRRRAYVVVLTAAAAALAGCSGTAPTITVSVAGQEETLDPTQYCLDGESQVFRDLPAPPVLRVAGDQGIRIEVPAEIADSGWQVQVYDSTLATQVGEVDAGNATTFDGIRTGDSAEPEFYLVIVQDAGEDCDGLSGAWPVGFVRTGD